MFLLCIYKEINLEFIFKILLHNTLLSLSSQWMKYLWLILCWCSLSSLCTRLLLLQMSSVLCFLVSLLVLNTDQIKNKIQSSYPFTITASIFCSSSQQSHLTIYLSTQHHCLISSSLLSPPELAPLKGTDYQSGWSVISPYLFDLFEAW